MVNNLVKNIYTTGTTGTLINSVILEGFILTKTIKLTTTVNTICLRFSNNLGALVDVDEMSVEPICFFDETDNYCSLEGYNNSLKNIEINDFLRFIASIPSENRCYISEINNEYDSIEYSFPNGYIVMVTDLGLHEYAATVFRQLPNYDLKACDNGEFPFHYNELGYIDDIMRFLNKVEALPIPVVDKFTNNLVYESVFESCKGRLYKFENGYGAIVMEDPYDHSKYTMSILMCLPENKVRFLKPEETSLHKDFIAELDREAVNDILELIKDLNKFGKLI